MKSKQLAKTVIYNVCNGKIPLNTRNYKVTYKVNGKKVSKDEYDQAVKKFDEDWDEHLDDDNYWEYLYSFSDVLEPRFTYNTNRYLHPLLVDLWRY